MPVVMHEMAFTRERLQQSRFSPQGQIEEEGEPGQMFASPESLRINQFLAAERR
ncbi:hypothetical protein [Rhizobium sp. 1399]|jgi:ABC-type histidine transport system ATPase subunit|uniref:hypothetical protein n=1 Tax=Rhizobium sp. 1399 TaxID=2817758 RepID=UPI0028544EBD|nr:hypothetical protein [Rhizobium sp. 1399]MDR6665649.1 ABC-type histidine transport system ATPase subunit [Rhizobium sp. 1399]